MSKQAAAQLLNELYEGHQMTTQEQAKDVIDQLFSIIASAPELNMSNYDKDEVSNLNEAMTEAYHVLTNYYAKQKESTK